MKFKKYIKIATGLIILLVIILAFFVKISPFRMPTGKYGVGKIAYHLVDTTRKETNSENINASRELMIYVHYPTDNKIESPITLYDLDALNSAKEFVNIKIGVPTFLLSGWNYIKTYAQDHAPISQSRKNYPVIIVSHGGGTMVQHYTWMLEELASHGYVVVGINHPYMAAITRMPDGRVLKSLVLNLKNRDKKLLELWKTEQIEICVADVEFVISQLKELNLQNLLQNKLDLKHIGYAGHSFGGHLALILGIKNSEISAVVDMDGGQKAFSYIIGKTCPIPCMIMLADKSRQWRTTQGKKDRKTLEDFYIHNSQNASRVIINGVGHGVFADLAILLNSTLFTRFISNIYDLDLDASSSICCKAIDEIGLRLVKFFDTNLYVESAKTK